MNSLIKQIEEYQKTKNEYLFEDLINKLNANIEYYIRHIYYEFKDDIKQEIYFKILDLLNNKYVIKRNSEFDLSVLNIDNFNEMSVNNFENVNEVLGLEYANCFINKYGNELLSLACFYDDYKLIFLEEYLLFINENQFIKYFRKTVQNLLINFKLKQSKENKIITKNLNEQISEDLEMIDTVIDNSTLSKIDPFDCFSKDDKEFIYLFIDNGMLLSEQEVAKKLGVSQQAVNKRKQKIKKKYFKVVN